MINVYYGANKKVFGQLFISVTSLVEKASEPVNIIALTIEIPEVDPNGKKLNTEHEKLLNDYVKSKNKLNSFKIIDVTNIFRERKLTSGVNLKSHFTPYANIRLVADAVKEIGDKIIYLDTDTIINGNIKELWDTNVENYELAAIKDLYRINPNYFQSAVLVLNMKKIRETKLFEKTINLVRTKKLIFVDQTALNIATKFYLKLPRRFNSMDKYYPEIVVHHICNVREGKIFLFGKWYHRIKPQEIELMRKKLPQYNRFYDLYEKHLKQAPHLFK